MLERISSDRLKTFFWFGIGTAILAFMIWLADVGKFLGALTKADPLYMVLACFGGLGMFLAWASNWHVFFQISEIECSFFKTFRLFSAGQFLNYVTPLGQFGGQPFLAYIISNNSDASFEESLATVMSADLLAIIPLSTFTLVGYSYLSFAGSTSSELTKLFVVTFLLLLFGIVMGYLGWFRAGSIENAMLRFFNYLSELTGYGEGLVDKLEGKLENVEKTFEKVGENPRIIVKSLAVTHSAFLFKMAAFYGVLVSLGLEMSPFYVMLLIPLSALANFSPTPGGAGTFEAAMAGIIVLFTDFTLATALTAAVLYRVATFWLGTLLGYVSLSSLNYDAEILGTGKPTPEKQRPDSKKF